MTQALLGCSDDPATSYAIEALCVAAADLLGVYIVGVPLGPVVSGVFTTVRATDGGNAQPSDVDVTYASSQGAATPLSYNMPRSGDSSGQLRMATDGQNWVQCLNTTDLEIDRVVLIASDGSQVLPSNNGFSGFLQPEGGLSDRGVWRPGEDLFITGVPDKVYKKISYQTLSGQEGELTLSNT